ncbi:diguanylate cyclase [Nitrospirillum iridis]|uniref:diguanylate cyclase n=1 Tax=Nitrospirillum iridis TaxID=765888 RepID=A0A7X0AU36_9PROT|nr:diguanylate cyclase [Nitrospirillum iridis]MBB6250068.1 diguanylate cyclase (GGDEF)-like protein [Nitrospirillum iridis]
MSTDTFSDMPSTASLPEELLARVRKIRQDFTAGLPDRLAQIRQAAKAVTDPDTDATQRARMEMARMAHALAGSGATFGLPELTVAARALEGVVNQPGGIPPTALWEAIAGLERSVTAAAPPAPVESLPTAPTPAPHGTLRTVYLMRGHGEEAGDLGEILAAYGYEMTIFQDAAGLAAAAGRSAPEAVILDVNPHDMAPGSAQLADARGRKIPTIALSSATGFAARLAAARAGCDAYVVKPPDANALVDHLDRLTEREPDQPLRILIVDDDATLGAYYETALQSAGMHTRLVTDPLQAVEALYDHNADLMVTDLIMPQCTGFELASVLRQYDALLALPIVFLTADLDAETQRYAVRTGVDAYLTKPVDLGDLAETVRARARRARQLKALMVRDGLTGAYNHPMIQDLLAAEVARAQRDGTNLSFAMLDIDHFKKVNDSYGHSAGDRVIKGLSRLLQQRLRRTDMIGRYGGEEFAVLMPHTNAKDAAERLDLLRQQFSEIPYVHGDTQFQVTFSGGVVGLRPGLDAKALNLAADAALYRAKNAGRNRIELG